MTAKEFANAAHEAEADRVWTAAVLGRLPPVTAAPGLSARVLAAFDVATARRRLGLFARWAETIWPGVPTWAPASALAVALVAGIGAGAVLPTQTAAETGSAFSLEAPPSFDLVASDGSAGDVR